MYEPRKLTPSEGKWLCNRAQRITSQLVYLGIHADPAEWAEITQAERDRLEAQWQEERAQEMENAPASDELNDSEALAILTGGDVNA